MWRVRLAVQFCRVCHLQRSPHHHPTGNLCRVSYPTARFLTKNVARTPCRGILSFSHLQRSPRRHPTRDLCRVSYTTTRFFLTKNFARTSFRSIWSFSHLQRSPRRHPTRDLCQVSYPTARFFLTKNVARPSCRSILSFLHLQRSPPSSPDSRLLSSELSDRPFFDQKCGAYVLPINFVVFRFATIPPSPVTQLSRVSQVVPWHFLVKRVTHYS
jgi:hypothetical protein